jgi:glucose/arabinose dehydrogenase
MIGSSPTRVAMALFGLGLWLSAPAALNAQEEFQSVHHDFRVVTVVDGLEHPWSMAWLPNGDMLVTERPGRLRIVRGGMLVPDPITGVPEVRAQGQGGLLDVTLHPDFESNRLIYLSFSKPNEDGSESTTAVVRGRLDDGALHDVEEIFEASMWSRSRGHYGSRFAWRDDGTLFISLGDRQQPPRDDLEAHGAQDRSTHTGTIIRINVDGSVPADNPFVGQEGIEPEIWSWGHRSPQGMLVHPETGDLWETEHGPQGGDELNLIEPGLNYGWPVIGYGVNYRTGNAIHASTHQEGMEQPKTFWVPSIATSGLMVYTGDQFPHWQGNMFSGGMRGQQLARIALDGQEVVAEETLMLGYAQIRDVRQGPDGFIYLAIKPRDDSDTTPIVRLEPVGH